jgi:hypothetical protein
MDIHCGGFDMDCAARDDVRNHALAVAMALPWSASITGWHRTSVVDAPSGGNALVRKVIGNMPRLS